MMPPLYRLEGIRRRLAGREVLALDELTVEAGKIYGLLGPNGAGKTTLMRLLAFLDVPDEGRIFFEGRPVSAQDGAALRSRVVWTPQTPVMFTGSLRWNVEYPMALKRRPKEERRSIADGLMRLVRLEHLAEAPAHKLSGGEAQRAGIARALAAGASVLLLDEPTANVDARSREELARLIRQVRQERGLSVIVTTHDIELADSLCEEYIALRDGRAAEHQGCLRAGGVKRGRVLTASPVLRLRLEGEGAALSNARVVGVEKSLNGLRVRLAGTDGLSADVLLPWDEAVASLLHIGLRAEVENGKVE